MGLQIGVAFALVIECVLVVGQRQNPHEHHAEHDHAGQEGGKASLFGQACLPAPIQEIDADGGAHASPRRARPAAIIKAGASSST